MISHARKHFMDINECKRESFDGLVQQAKTTLKNSETDAWHLRFIGALVGGLLGFIGFAVLFGIALFWDQNYSQPSDPDFAKPAGVILFALIFTVVGSIVGFTLWLPLARELKNRKLVMREAQAAVRSVLAEIEPVGLPPSGK